MAAIVHPLQQPPKVNVTNIAVVNGMLTGTCLGEGAEGFPTQDGTPIPDGAHIIRIRTRNTMFIVGNSPIKGEVVLNLTEFRLYGGVYLAYGRATFGHPRVADGHAAQTSAVLEIVTTSGVFVPVLS